MFKEARRVKTWRMHVVDGSAKKLLVTQEKNAPLYFCTSKNYNATIDSTELDNTNLRTTFPLAWSE